MTSTTPNHLDIRETLRTIRKAHIRAESIVDKARKYPKDLPRRKRRKINTELVSDARKIARHNLAILFRASPVATQKKGVGGNVQIRGLSQPYKV